MPYGYSPFLQPPPDTLPLSRRAPAMTQQASIPGAQTPELSGNLPAPPGQDNFKSRLLRALPTIGAGLMAAIGGPNRAIGNFGLGGATAGSNMLLNETLRRRQEEAQQEQNTIKNVHADMEEVSRIPDPRYQAVVQEYKQALEGGLTGKEALKLHQSILGLGDIKGTVKRADDARALQAYQEQKRFDQSLEDEELEKYGVPFPVMPGVVRKVSPDTAARLTQAQVEGERRAQHDRDMMYQANRRYDLLERKERIRQENYKRVNSEENVRLAADALESGQVKDIDQASRLAGVGEDRKDFGLRILSEMARRNTAALPPQVRLKSAQIDQSIKVIDNLQELIRASWAAEDIKERGLQERLISEFISTNAAAISSALGEGTQKSEGDIRRALSLTPNWWERGGFPDYAMRKLDLGKKQFRDNQATLVKGYFKSYNPQTGEGSFNDSLAAPPGASPNPTPTPGPTQPGAPPMPPPGARRFKKIAYNKQTQQWVGTNDNWKTHEPIQ